MERHKRPPFTSLNVLLLVKSMIWFSFHKRQNWPINVMSNEESGKISVLVKGGLFDF